MKIKNFLGNIVIAVLAAFLAIIIYINYFQGEFAEHTKSDLSGIQQELANDSNQMTYEPKLISISGNMQDFTEAAEKTVHAVVHVTSKYNLENSESYNNPIYDWLFGDGYSQKPSVSFGSGVIISQDGYIVY